MSLDLRTVHAAGVFPVPGCELDFSSILMQYCMRKIPTQKVCTWRCFQPLLGSFSIFFPLRTKRRGVGE